MSSAQLNTLICAYLKHLETSSGSGYNKDALSLALSCVMDALKVPDTVEASDVLEKIFSEGVKSVPLPAGFSGPLNVDEETVKKAEALKNEGNEMFKAGNYNGAIAKFSDSISLNPAAPTYSNRALCYMKLNRYDKAEEDARSAIRADSKFSRGYLRLSAALEAQNRFADAVTVLRDLVAFAPEYSGDLEEMQSKAASASKGTSGTGPAGAGGLPGGLPNIPGLEELMKDPEIQALMMNPKMAKIAEEIKTGGIGAAMKYMSDPEIAPLFQKLTSKLLGGSGGLGGMFGGNGHI